MVLLAVALLGLALWLRLRFPGIENHNRSAWLLLPASLLAGAITEIGAWADAYVGNEAEPALFHPQLAWDLGLAAPFYLGWGLAWLWLLRRHAYRLRDIFLIQGLFGVVVEQNGAVLIAGLGSMPLGLVMWAFVLAVYGSTMALAALFSGRPAPKRADVSWWRRALLAAVVIFAATWAIFGTFLLLLELFGIDVPAAQPIRDHPIV